jgi:hypothetical protein
MSLDQQQIELINAAVDGELSASERTAFEALLAANSEAQAVCDDLCALADTLNAVEAIPPPANLRHSILNAVETPKRTNSLRGLWDSLWSVPLLRPASAFAAGVVVAIIFMSSERNSRHAFDDVAGLVGTISQTNGDSGISVDSRLTLSSSELAGTVKSWREGSMMVIDFDLTTNGPVEIVADFADADVWFNGFAQLENPGTQVAVAAGRVTLQMQGSRRYAVYLHNASREAAVVRLKFFADGELIHDDEIRFSRVE